MKGSERNQPCACGSGKKTKKCCGKPPSREEVMLQRERDEKARLKRRAEEEEHYRIHGRRKAGDLVRALAAVRSSGWWGV